MKSIRLLYYLTITGITTIMLFNKIIIDRSEEYLYNEIIEVPKMNTALVLGAAKYGNQKQLNPYYKYRIEAAAELYHAQKVNRIIVSGDNHIVGYDEPTDMANSLIELGVPKSKIILDYAGFRTLDSVVRAKKVFNCQELIIVSQKFHNQRAVYAARNFGIDAIGYNARDVQSTSNFTHYREFASKFLMILDLHVFNTKPKFL